MAIEQVNRKIEEFERLSVIIDHHMSEWAG